MPFSVIDTSQEVGRRVQRFVYPGIDDAAFQDLGADDGPISIKGLLAGDDYIAQSRALRAVFRSPGPYMLVHPWLGSFQVVLAPGQRPRISLTNNEMRIARFEMQVLPYTPEAQPGLDTLSALEVACDKLTADAQNWLANAMAPAVNTLGAFGYVTSLLGNVSNIFTAAIATTNSAGEIATAAAGALSALAIPTTAPSATWAASTAAQLVALPAAVAGACTPPVPAAVAAGGATIAAAAADATDTTNTLLATLPAIAATASNAAPAPALAAALQAAILSAAITAASNIVYDSQQAAEAQAAILFAALDAAIYAAASAAQTDPANAAPVWRDLVALKAALSADLNALVGRLPAVVTINLFSTTSAWLLAQYISGDTPSQVVATYRDIIARNGIFHPAIIPAGPVEVLNA